MATREEIERIARRFNTLPHKIEVCHDIAQAQLEVGERLRSDNLFGGGSDWERARGELLELTRNLNRAISSARRTTLSEASPALIRAHAAVKEISECCRSCLHHNLSHTQNDAGFECLVSKLENRRQDAFRFRLSADDSGSIIEYEH